MLKCCQMVTDDGLQECGFLIGNICKANREKEFRISADFLRCLMIVGCQSWQRYLDYDERSKRFGTITATKNQTDGKEGRKPYTATCEADRKLQEVRELQQRQVDGDRSSGRNDREKTVPMRILQENSDSDGNTLDDRSVGHHMKHLTCFICGINAIAKSEDGFYLCAEHYEKRKDGKTLKELKDKEEKL